MDIRPLTDRYAVSPQILPEDMPALRAGGYAAVICNRPDEEVPPELGSAAMREAAEAAGLAFVHIPVVHGALGPDTVDAQRRAIAEAGGPVMAYCASGTRSTIVWMLGAAPETAPDALLQAAQSQGYALEMLRPQLEALHRG
jgi:uncharacterized protein (TIGR01244 family)